MRSERAWAPQCWKSCVNGSNIVALRFSDHGTQEMLGVVGWKVWPVSNFAQQHATTSNNIQQGVQTDATCNIQQCWELLANNVASVCTGLNFVYTIVAGFATHCASRDGALHPRSKVWSSTTPLYPGISSYFFVMLYKIYPPLTYVKITVKKC